MSFQKQIFSMAKQDIKTLVFPEASFSDKIMQAVKIITQKSLAKIILIGDESALYIKYSSVEGPLLKIINPKTTELKKEVTEKIVSLKLENLQNQEEAERLAEDPYYFATMLVLLGYADGMVSGTESVSTKTYEPVLSLLNNSKTLSSAVLFLGKNKALSNRPILISDGSLMSDPNEKELCEVANNAVEFWKMIFIKEPKVAFLSNSTNSGDKTDKMAKAAKMFAEKHPTVISDGELQLDAAIVPKIQEKKYHNSKIKGDANILIAPNSVAGNLLCKAFHFVGGLKAIGPLSLGFSKPVSNISRNASVEEIVLISAITAVQSQTD